MILGRAQLPLHAAFHLLYRAISSKSAIIEPTTTWGRVKFASSFLNLNQIETLDEFSG
ncbi:MAG: hypothetical protein Kow00121_38160 [Elainellaceae cyanobacterium]